MSSLVNLFDGVGTVRPESEFAEFSELAFAVFDEGEVATFPVPDPHEIKNEQLKTITPASFLISQLYTAWDRTRPVCNNQNYVSP